MKWLKSILTTLGLIFVLIIALFAFFANRSAAFADQHAPLVTRFTEQFSDGWQVRQVAPLMHNDLVTQFYTTQGQALIANLQRLGKPVQASDITLKQYKRHTNGTRIGVFTFKAQFDNAYGVVTVELHELDDEARIVAFHFTPVGELQTPRERST